MAIMDKFKLWIDCKKNGRMEEYNQYKSQSESIKDDIGRRTEWLAKAKEAFSRIQQVFPPDSKKYISAKEDVQKWEYSLNEAKCMLNFIRPNNQEDIIYRNEQISNFSARLRGVISPNLDLRFHGTPIYYAQQIIKSATISSIADRYDGYQKSSDERGQISVADSKTLDRTINNFSDMVSYNMSMPAGCIFALLPKDKEDASHKEASVMNSINFRENPQQLFGIFTTPENINRVKNWMREAKLNPDLVYTFEEFLQTVEIKSAEIDIEEKKKNWLNIYKNPNGYVKKKQHPKNPIGYVKKKQQPNKELGERDF